MSHHHHTCPSKGGEAARACFWGGTDDADTRPNVLGTQNGQRNETNRDPTINRRNGQIRCTLSNANGNYGHHRRAADRLDFVASSGARRPNFVSWRPPSCSQKLTAVAHSVPSSPFPDSRSAPHGYVRPPP